MRVIWLLFSLVSAVWCQNIDDIINAWTNEAYDPTPDAFCCQLREQTLSDSCYSYLYSNEVTVPVDRICLSRQDDDCTTTLIHMTLVDGADTYYSDWQAMSGNFYYYLTNKNLTSGTEYPHEYLLNAASAFPTICNSWESSILRNNRILKHPTDFCPTNLYFFWWTNDILVDNYFSYNDSFSEYDLRFVTAVDFTADSAEGNQQVLLDIAASKFTSYVRSLSLSFLDDWNCYGFADSDPPTFLYTYLEPTLENVLTPYDLHLSQYPDLHTLALTTIPTLSDDDYLAISAVEDYGAFEWFQPYNTMGDTSGNMKRAASVCEALSRFGWGYDEDEVDTTFPTPNDVYENSGPFSVRQFMSIYDPYFPFCNFEPDYVFDVDVSFTMEGFFVGFISIIAPVKASYIRLVGCNVIFSLFNGDSNYVSPNVRNLDIIDMCASPFYPRLYAQSLPPLALFPKLAKITYNAGLVDLPSDWYDPNNSTLKYCSLNSIQANLTLFDSICNSTCALTTIGNVAQDVLTCDSDDDNLPLCGANLICTSTLAASINFMHTVDRLCSYYTTEYATGYCIGRFYDMRGDDFQVASIIDQLTSSSGGRNHILRDYRAISKIHSQRYARNMHYARNGHPIHGIIETNTTLFMDDNLGDIWNLNNYAFYNDIPKNPTYLINELDLYDANMDNLGVTLIDALFNALDSYIIWDEDTNLEDYFGTAGVLRIKNTINGFTLDEDMWWWWWITNFEGHYSPYLYNLIDVMQYLQEFSFENGEDNGYLLHCSYLYLLRAKRLSYINFDHPLDTDSCADIEGLYVMADLVQLLQSSTTLYSLNIHGRLDHPVPMQSFFGYASMMNGANAVMQIIDLSDVRINDTITPWFAHQYGEVVFLRMTRCDIYGDFPDLSEMSNLDVIDFSDNAFMTGDVSQKLADWRAYKFVDFSNTSVNGTLTSDYVFCNNPDVYCAMPETVDISDCFYCQQVGG